MTAAVPQVVVVVIYIQVHYQQQRVGNPASLHQGQHKGTRGLLALPPQHSHASLWCDGQMFFSNGVDKEGKTAVIFDEGISQLQGVQQIYIQRIIIATVNTYIKEDKKML